MRKAYRLPLFPFLGKFVKLLQICCISIDLEVGLWHNNEKDTW